MTFFFSNLFLNITLSENERLAQAASMAVGWQVNDRRRLHHYAFILTLYNENPGEIKSVLERFLRKSPGHFYGGGVVVGVNF